MWLTPLYTLHQLERVTIVSIRNAPHQARLSGSVEIGYYLMVVYRYQNYRALRGAQIFNTEFSPDAR